MTATSPTKPSTRRPSDERKLTEVARHVVMPDGITSTGWPRVRARCAEFGDAFDTWQDGAGQLILGKREDGRYAATVGGVVLSIPRQVAKTFLVGRIVFALCTLHPGLTVLWTAHRTRTSTKTFETLKALARRPAVLPYLPTTRNRGMRNSNGEQEIRFANGSVVMFGAREQGFGRGFEEIDTEVFDEAQILTERALEDMVAATNQSRFPAGALLFYMGTPPRPIDPGEVFAGKRADALSGEATDMVYIECSADEDADPDDREQWRKANPSYPDRTPEESMLRLRKNLPSLEAWRREAYGIWDKNTARSVIDWDAWSGRRISWEQAPIEGVVALGVKFSADGQRVGAAVAVQPEEGPVHVVALGVQSATTGASQLVGWIGDRWRQAATILVDGKAGAGDLVAELRAAGVPQRRARVVPTDEAVTAHAGMLRAIEDGDLTHSGQPGLDAAVRVAGRRRIGSLGGWGWQSITPEGDVTALDAATLARHGAVTSGRKTNRRADTRTSRRRAVVV